MRTHHLSSEAFVQAPIDPSEIWKDIPGYEGIYSVSNLGNVRRDLVCRGASGGPVFPNRSKSTGYLSINLTRECVQKRLYVHRLVLLAFVGEDPEKPQCNHKNGNKSDNRLENLEWCTGAHNSQHAYDALGRIAIHGVKHYCAKLNPEKVRQARKMRADGMTFRLIGKHLGIDEKTAWHAIKGTSWKDVI